ncbi:cullin-associated NEDD8-dissociated protein 1-like isoform X3 [Trematomus bernacchii]|uniref:cullin-associated NEDD8-dissociated protein 1-like isoform X3 n=1 Tax=Trematomus bernacchii TaxID=40690 RepID=UPI00146A37BE|nr:cullin-associated NEDD8-dissociated protein 1-like isoform X3 [Trematomus bernacchii]
MAVRKHSILALGHLVPCCSPALFSQLTEHLTNELAKAPPVSMARTYIQCLATVSRQGGHRVEKLIPMVLKFTDVEDDELRDCPKEMLPR